METNDIEQFRFLNVMKDEVMKMRFDYNMNLLQLICFEEANLILDFIRAKFEGDIEAKRQLAQHRETSMGSQAIHLAAATGNRYIIEVLMLEFEGDPFENTDGNQTVMHCAAQRYEGVLSIFIFNRCHGIEVTQVDNAKATALHFATTNMLIKNV